MRRDMNVIKTVLLRVEELKGLGNIYSMFPEYFDMYKVVKGTEEEGELMIYHFDLLVESGFINGDVSTKNVFGLTWEGHNLIDHLR